jgi:magnesium chelatase subunit D
VTTGPTLVFPLSAVVAQDDLTLALLLNAVDPRIGGVLVRGEKGSAKSTAARGLAALLPGDAPFVELPVGATEDRVVGSLNLEKALVTGVRELQPGLLHSAHRGVLYVDEVNLLPDHIVDVLLDAAASGVNRIEREGMAVEHPARFVLAGSMNPEEGELRPQLLDRFGLAVEVHAPVDPVLRSEAVRRRLAFERDPDAFLATFAKDEQALRDGVRDAVAALDAGEVRVPAEIVDFISALCAQLGAEGLRADLVLTRGVAALSALEGRDEATVADVARLAPLALAHRRRRGPFDPPTLDPHDLENALNALERGGPVDDEAGDTDDGSGPEPDRPVADAAGSPALRVQARKGSGALGRRERGPAARGGVVATEPAGADVHDIAVVATATAAAVRRASKIDQPAITGDDLRRAVREARTANLIIFAVDASGSMGTQQRMEAAKGAILSLLLDAYQRRDRVAMITFRGEDADIVLRPTGSIEVARARLAQIPTGGRTPLAAGILAAVELARGALRRDASRRPVLVLVTDGRSTSGPDPRDAAHAAAAAGIDSLVVDVETGPAKLGLAHELADVLGARYVSLPHVEASDLRTAVDGVLQ